MTTVTLQCCVESALRNGLLDRHGAAAGGHTLIHLVVMGVIDRVVGTVPGCGPTTGVALGACCAARRTHGSTDTGTGRSHAQNDGERQSTSGDRGSRGGHRSKNTSGGQCASGRSHHDAHSCSFDRAVARSLGHGAGVPVRGCRSAATAVHVGGAAVEGDDLLLLEVGNEGVRRSDARKQCMFHDCILRCSAKVDM